MVYSESMNNMRQRRFGFCAEIYSEDDAMAFVKKVVPKNIKTHTLLERALKKKVLFSNLDETQRKDIIDSMYPLVYTAGHTIIEKNSECDNFYIIENGTVEVYSNNRRVSIIKNNGSFGESSLINGTNFEFTFKAKTNVKLWTIDRDSYRKIVMSNEIKKQKLYDEYMRRISIFNNLNNDERSMVMNALEKIEFNNGDVIVKEGDDDNHLYLIEEGTAIMMVVSDDSKLLVNHLGPSDYFNKKALLNHYPNDATVIAVESLKCAKLDRTRFERLIGPCDDLINRHL